MTSCENTLLVKWWVLWLLYWNYGFFFWHKDWWDASLKFLEWLQ